ncbi:MAG TPA: potassium-transporting ATPase subunit KdpC [Bacillota bacterium]|nr:potassium-transporting ATPase subunit KdpC [Bacillota bacterium]
MKTLWNALRISLVMLIICGLLYPLAMTGLGRIIFPKQSGGSVIYYRGKPAGSELLGQNFTDLRFFHGRVSAVNYNTYTKADTVPGKDGKTAYGGVSSGSANLAPSNPALVERVKKDIEEFLKTHPGIKKDDIPTDLLTSSGSGLDPHISPAAARIQIPVIAKATGFREDDLEALVTKYTEGRQWGIFGEPRFNFVKANLEIGKRL